MAGEEHEHFVFWRNAIELACKGVVPQLFDAPDAIVIELMDIKGKIESLLATTSELAKSRKSPPDGLQDRVLQFHSVVVPLLNFVRRPSAALPYDDYEAHISGFVEMFESYDGILGEEIRLLNEMLKKLWGDNLKLARQSYLDELTGIFNRRGFANAASPIISLMQRRVSTMSFMIADIDHFKRINDLHGHPAGDRALVEAVEAIRENLRGSDIIARDGGEEFIALCPDIADESGGLIAERIRLAVENRKTDGPKITISVGVVDAIPPIGMNATEIIGVLCAHADRLLCRRKKRGGTAAWRKRIASCHDKAACAEARALALCGKNDRGDDDMRFNRQAIRICVGAIALALVFIAIAPACSLQRERRRRKWTYNNHTKPHFRKHPFR
jgi:diguanylate cyclase (GGDEF)-like protein